MAEPKTQLTKVNPREYLKTIADEQRRKDCKVVMDLMSEVTNAKPEMWGGSIVGFGRYLYKYASGRQDEWMVTGFSSRKGDLTLYIMPGFAKYPDQMKQLGKYKTGKSCLYIKKLADVDLDVLRTLVSKAVADMDGRRTDK